MQPRTEQPPGGRDFVPLMRRLSMVEPQPLPWLWPGRIPVGKLTLLAGDPGVGKSLLTIDMAARITAGRPWPDQADDQLPEPGDVIYIGTEDDMADTLRPRLEAAGGDPSRFYVLTGCADPHRDGWHPLKLPRDRIVVYQMGRALPATKLIIIDPLAGFLADSDAHTPMRIRSVLRTLMEEMDTFGMAVVAITHLSKSGPLARRALYRSAGSLSFLATARAAHLVAPDPQDPGRRLMLPLKNNLTGESFGLAFRIDGPRIVWEDGAVTTTADEALVAPQEGPDRRELAAKWLGEVLSAGPVKSVEVVERGCAAGFTFRQIRLAGEEIGAVPRREGRGWVWELASAAAGTSPTQRVEENA